MERTGPGSFLSYLNELSVVGEDYGPLVGVSALSGRDVRLPESSLEAHVLVLGLSREDRRTFINRVLAHKLKRKAMGKDEGAVVVIDPHGQLARDTLKVVPQSIADKVRLLDFGDRGRAPSINLLDPTFFPNRDRLVEAIVRAIRTFDHLEGHWDVRLEDLLRYGLLIIYDFNSHPDTPRSEMLTMLDISALLKVEGEGGAGPGVRAEMSPFQRQVVSRVSDHRFREWFRWYRSQGSSLGSEAVGLIHAVIGAYASDEKAAAIIGQRESIDTLAGVFTDGLALLVSTARDTIGAGPATLMGSAIVSLVESALKDPRSLPPSGTTKCLLVCEEFETVAGADWEGLLWEIERYGCSLMLATQSLARLNAPERKLENRVVVGVSSIVAYGMAADDARIIQAQMATDRVKERHLVNLDPHHCYVRIGPDRGDHPVMSINTLPQSGEVPGSQYSVEAVLEANKPGEMLVESDRG